MAVLKDLNKPKLKSSGLKVILADEPVEPCTKLSDALVMVHGERGIGKTTLFAEYPDPYFIMFEPGAKFLRVRQTFCPTFKHFLKLLEMIEAKPNGYAQNYIVDTGYMFYERCFEFMQDQMKLSDPRDKAWGNGWKKIDREFRDAHTRLFNLGGFGVTAHSELKVTKPRAGVEIEKIVTQLGGQAHRWYAGLVDVIGYYHYNAAGNRVMTIRGSNNIEAKCRMPENFNHTDGSPVVRIPMGNNPKDSYKNLVRGFNNQLPPPEKKGVRRK
jgi:hypothetical protein